MNTKIDISSLDAATRKKIKVLGNRSKQIQKGVSKSVCLKFKPIKFKVEAEWDEGTTADRNSCYLVDFDYDLGFFGNADEHISSITKAIKDAHENFKKKIDDEIKIITAFSNKIADKLRVDRNEFFNQYFLY